MIAIIDYGMGNLFSVHKAFASLGADAVITSDADVIASAEKVVLPGVGAFGDCMKNLTRLGLVDVIREVTKQQTPFLGICLGLQLLFEGSDEDPAIPGLGILHGRVRRIKAPALKVPHIGWNSLEFPNASPLFSGLTNRSYVYFVHSYHAVPEDSRLVTAVTDYGGNVTAAIGSGYIQAVQFHPEKSSSVGLKILANFKEMKP